jgi:hypothetical protein
MPSLCPDYRSEHLRGYSINKEEDDDLPLGEGCSSVCQILPTSISLDDTVMALALSFTL